MNKALFSACVFLIFMQDLPAQQVSIMPIEYEIDLLERLSIQNLSLPSEFSFAQKYINIANINSWVNEKSSTRLDKSNLAKFQQRITQLTKHSDSTLEQKGLWNTLYTNPSYFYQSNGLKMSKKNFFFGINPIIYYNQSFEKNDTINTYQNTRGLEIQGQIADKVYFYSNLLENQERLPSYAQAYASDMRQVPGGSFWKNFKSSPTYDYSIANAYLSLPVLKNHMSFTLGHGRHFIGDGYRSLMLSDFGAVSFYAKLNTRIWKFNYQNLFSELNPIFTSLADNLKAKKYMASHHLSYRVTPRLEVGAFENVIFARENQFEFQYLNPVIFYRSVETHLGSPDNVNLGLNGKLITNKHSQLYTQVLLDEFKFSELKANKHWYGNKYAIQVGGKYINFANIDHLDIQIEYNHIRPFMYSYSDSLRDYSHYNQPLAHPNGANLREFINIISYQPTRKVRLKLEYIHRVQGLDSSLTNNNGGTIYKPNTTPVLIGQIYGYKTGGGIRNNTQYTNLHASYEVIPNTFIEGGLTRRSDDLHPNASITYIGLRMNTARKKYNY